MSNNHTKMQPLTLHAHSTGPNPIKIAIACEYLKIPYTIKMWNFGDDAETGVKGTAFLKINENGRVRESLIQLSLASTLPLFQANSATFPSFAATRQLHWKIPILELYHGSLELS